MPTSESRKRQRLGESGLLEGATPAKRSKSTEEIEFDVWASWVYPAEFWDRLSRVELTRGVLDAFDRETRIPRRDPSPPRSLVQLDADMQKQIADFAIQVGPDLNDIRGYRNPTKKYHDDDDDDHASSGHLSDSVMARATNAAYALPEATATEIRMMTLYDRNFDLHLTDHHVYAPFPSQQPDVTQIKEELATSRLPPGTKMRLPKGAVEEFQKSNTEAKTMDDLLTNVIPVLFGTTEYDYLFAKNIPFINLAPLTDGTIPPAVPDFYDGAHPEEFDAAVRSQLARYIVPTGMPGRPMLPNFFLEIKGPDGTAAVGVRKTRCHGALGARGMHALQNYGKAGPLEYDGRAYTFSAIYHGGSLRLYAHHLTAPIAPNRPPEYHMTQLAHFTMISTRLNYVKGTTAFRNARDMAFRCRERFIKEANARAAEGRKAATAAAAAAAAPAPAPAARQAHSHRLSALFSTILN